MLHVDESTLLARFKSMTTPQKRVLAAFWLEHLLAHVLRQENSDALELRSVVKGLWSGQVDLENVTVNEAFLSQMRDIMDAPGDVRGGFLLFSEAIEGLGFAQNTCSQKLLHLARTIYNFSDDAAQCDLSRTSTTANERSILLHPYVQRELATLMNSIEYVVNSVSAGGRPDAETLAEEARRTAMEVFD